MRHTATGGTITDDPFATSTRTIVAQDGRRVWKYYENSSYGDRRPISRFERNMIMSDTINLYLETGEFYKEHESRLGALESQFERRLNTGKCFSQPYFGQREFVAYFAPAGEDKPIGLNQKLGYMVYDVFDLSVETVDCGAPFITLFEAEIKDGVMDIPPWNDSRVIKPS